MIACIMMLMFKKYIGKNSNIKQMAEQITINQCKEVHTALNIMYVIQRFISIEKCSQGIDESKHIYCMIPFWEKRKKYM